MRHERRARLGACPRREPERRPDAGGAVCSRRSVAIPNLTSAGLLPTGIHLATLHEVELTFGRGTDTRIRLYESLRAFLELARAFQMFTSIVIDGSFVTNEPDPSDVDVVLILPGPQLKRLMKHSDYLKLESAAVRERFAIDLFIDPDLEGMATSFRG